MNKTHFLSWWPLQQSSKDWSQDRAWSRDAWGVAEGMKVGAGETPIENTAGAGGVRKIRWSREEGEGQFPSEELSCFMWLDLRCLFREAACNPSQAHPTTTTLASHDSLNKAGESCPPALQWHLPLTVSFPRTSTLGSLPLLQAPFESHLLHDRPAPCLHLEPSPFLTHQIPLSDSTFCFPRVFPAFSCTVTIIYSVAHLYLFSPAIMLAPIFSDDIFQNA